MTTETTWSRRRLLGVARSAGALALLGAAAPAVLRPGLADAAACILTPRQSEGPFYPPRFGEPGNDLLVRGPDDSPGETILISGRVTDAACRPVRAAVVEIWQADASGHYHHPRDLEAPDARFRYWGRAVTDAEGRYRFRTIQPAPYKMGWGSWRTPHVHFKVRPSGAGVLTTQMYFEGHELNRRDGLLDSLSDVERAAALARPEAQQGGQTTTWRFDIAVA